MGELAKLVFAPGVRPICLRIAGADLPDVFTFGDISDEPISRGRQPIGRAPGNGVRYRLHWL
jgi:NAD(P)H-nitrite reductase large subunit